MDMDEMESKNTKVICVRCDNEIAEDMESMEYMHGYLCEECMDDTE